MFSSVNDARSANGTRTSAPIRSPMNQVPNSTGPRLGDTEPERVRLSDPTREALNKPSIAKIFPIIGRKRASSFEFFVSQVAPPD